MAGRAGSWEQTEVSEQLRELVARELGEGERILWVGQPIPKLYARKVRVLFLFGVFLTVMSLGGLAFTIMFLVLIVRSEEGLSAAFMVPFLLGSVVSVLIAIVMLLAPWWMRRKAARTVYAITDSRAIIFEAGASATVRPIEGRRLESLATREHPDGSGDILFTGGLPDRPGQYAAWRGTGFTGIANVRETARLLREVAKAQEEMRMIRETDSG